MATRDELTGLYNRRYFSEALEKEITEGCRRSRTTSLCIVDIDHFKAVNDTFGHPAGDMVLSEVGGILAQASRKRDVVCRCGGEEFALILPETDAGQAAVVCDRLRSSIAGKVFEWESRTFSVTASFGIATANGGCSRDPGRLVTLADKALYRAKAGGRNRVVVHREDDSATALDSEPQ